MIKISKAGLSIIVASILLVGCWDGDSSSFPINPKESTISDTTPDDGSNDDSSGDEIVRTIGRGVPGKGPFAKGSSIVLRKLNSDGSYTGDEKSTKTIDDKGTYSIEPGWTGITEVIVTGKYLNEATGTYMDDGNISAIVNLSGDTSASANIFTDMEAAIIKKKLQDGELQTKSFEDIKAEAREIVQEQFKLKLNGAKLEELDMVSTKKEANAQLMKVSAALMKTPNPKETLKSIKDDMEDGKVDEVGLGAVQEIKDKAKDIDVKKVEKQIEENIPGTDAPSEDSLEGTLSLDTTIDFKDIIDATPNTEYTSSVTIDGVIGDSADVTISGGTFTVNGKESSKVSNGDLLEVTSTSLTDFDQSKEIIVTIGGTNFSFVIQNIKAPDLPDFTPDEFDFGFKSNQELNTQVVSTTQTITGIDDNTTISIVGGEYSIDGGTTWTDNNDTINSDQNVTVRLTSADDFSVAKTAKVTIGTMTKNFVVITKQKDINPEPVSFSPKFDVNTSIPVESDEITVEGINAPISISIEGGEYSIDGGSYTAVDGTVTNGQKVKVKLISSANFMEEKTANLYLGDMIVPFKVITMEEPKEHDTIPTIFSFEKIFTDEKDIYQEASIQVKGINEETDISIEGGEYSINGAAFTTDKGKVNLDDNVTVRVKSPDYGKVAKATLTIGGVSANLEVETNDDQIPDPITLKPIIDAEISTVYEANATIKGISHPVTISVVEGDDVTLLVNGVESTTIDKDDNLTVKLKSAAEPATIKTAKIKVGKSTFVFTILTKAPAPKFAAESETKEVLEDSVFAYTPVLEQGEATEWDVNKSTLPSWLKFDKRVGKFYGIPKNEDVGTYNIELTAINKSGSDSETLIVEVINVNDAPLFNDEDKIITLDENNESSMSYSFELNATDVDQNDTITYSVEPNSSEYVDISIEENKFLVLTLKPNVIGHTSKKLDLKVIATDSEGATAEQKITLNLIGKNIKPVLGGLNIPSTIDEDSTPITVNLSATDIDGDPITYSAISSDPSIVTVAVNGSTLTLTPQPNANGTVEITVKPFDSIDYGEPLIFTVNITPKNDKPVLFPLTYPDIQEDSGAISIDLNATDVDGDTLTFEITDVSDLVDANITGSTLNILPKPDAYGLAKISVIALDGTTVSDPQTLSLNILPVNDAPVAVDDSDSTDNKHTLTIDILQNDTDVDGDPLTIKSITQPSSGSVAIVDNKIVFTPNQADTNLTTTFTYTVTDGELDDNATVTIEIGEYKSALAISLDKIDEFDPETDDVEAKLDEIKETLEAASADDKEAAIGLAILDLADVLNSPEVANLISIKSDGEEISGDYLPLFIKNLTDDNTSYEFVINTVNDLSGVTTDVLHNLSTKLVDIVENIENAYISDDAVIKIGDTVINKDKANLINFYALVAASNLELLAAYHYADADDIKTNTEEINGMTVEYTKLSADPVSVLNKSNTFTVSNTTRLSNAKALLLEAISKLDNVDISKLDMDDQELEDISNIKSESSSIKNSIQNGSDYIVERTKEVANIIIKYKEYYNLSALYSENTAIQLSTFGTNYKYVGGDYDPIASKIENKPVDSNHKPLKFEPEVLPTTSTSSLDDILKRVDITIDEETNTFTGSDIFNYILDDNIELDMTEEDGEIIYTVSNPDESNTYLWKFVYTYPENGITLTNTTGVSTKVDISSVEGDDISYVLVVIDKYGHTEKTNNCICKDNGFTYEMLSGITVYSVNEDRNASDIAVITYGEDDNHTRAITLGSFDQQNQYVDPYTIDEEGRINVNDKVLITLLEQNDEYINVSVEDLNTGETTYRRIYFDREAAEDYIGDVDADSSSHLDFNYDMLNGKTFYVVNENDLQDIGVITYSSDENHTITITDGSFDQQDYYTADYTIDEEGRININDETLITLLEVYDDRLLVLDKNLNDDSEITKILFFEKESAEAYIESSDTTTGSYFTYESLSGQTFYSVNDQNVSDIAVITYGEGDDHTRAITLGSFEQQNQYTSSYTIDDEGNIHIDDKYLITLVEEYPYYSYVSVKDLETGDITYRRSYFDKTEAEAFVLSRSSTLSFDYDMLSNLTLYSVDVNDKSQIAVVTYGEGDNHTRAITFGSFDQNNEVVDSYTIDDQGHINVDGKVLITLIERNDDYLLVTIENLFDHHILLVRSYYDRSKAEEYAGIVSPTIPFTSDMLDGKTFYLSYEDDSNSDNPIVMYCEVSFTTSDLNYKCGKKDDDDTLVDSVEGTISYELMEDGRLKEVEENGEVAYYVLKEDTSTYWALDREEDNNDDGTIENVIKEVWYFDKPSDYPSDL